MDLYDSDKQEPIAIVGVGFRFAGGVSSLGSLWDMISKVKTGHGPVPHDRWNSAVWHHPDPDRKGGITQQHGYFLDQDISHFDAPFFSVTAKEAAAMDPMKRMLLEVCYESIENAGIPVEKLMNTRTGCYVGCMTNDYEMISLHDIYNIGHPAATGLSEAMTANRVSWFFGLKGPSLTLDTACSSSLYALHLACQSLRLRETNMSLVTGVNLMINPNTSHQLTAMHMLSPDGTSHTFDDRANGYGRGDGIGSMVIKRLSDAIRDGDTIRAVIRGSGVNADGKTPSVTQPSASAQAELINQTYADAGLDLAETGFFECHGTGTPIGDPLELTAIGETIGAARRAAGKAPLQIGSIKPSVGHTEGCAGLAGVFKSILLLEKGILVPTYGVERINPKLKLRDWHLTLPEDVMTWPEQGLRRISVNAFGFGGANAHVILDDAYHYMLQRGLKGKHNVDVHTSGSDSGLSTAQSSELTHDPSKQLFLFSGKDQMTTKRVLEGFATWLEKCDSDDKQDIVNLDNLANTLALHRSHMEHRTFAIADSSLELSQKLSKGLLTPIRSQRHGDNLVLVFTGQGAQWPAMGRELFEHPIFRQSINASQSYLDTFGCQWNAVEELTKPANANVNLPEYSQPLCTIVQVAIVDLLHYWKINPTATVGHSSGEIAAAYAALLLTHRDAVKLAYVRGISSAAVTKKGAMMAAGLSEQEAQEYLEKVSPDSVVIACVNSPSSVTLSGDVDVIDELEKTISADGKFARKLKVTTAYHSPHMRDVSKDYLAMIGEIRPQEPQGKDIKGRRPVMYSSLTGCLVTSPQQLNAQYWVDNMQNPVKFSQTVSALLKHKITTPGNNRASAVQWGGFLEVGPHAAMQGPLRQIIDVENNKFAKSAPYVSLLVRGKDAIETSLNAVGTLWAAGAKMDLATINNLHKHGDAPQMLCDLPTYPWNHSRSFWHESYSSHVYRFPTEARNDFLGIAEDSRSMHEPRWRNYLRISENPWIEDHVITGTVLYPGAGMLVMALEGALRTADSSKSVEGFRMLNVAFERGMVMSLDDDAPLETRISLHPHSSKPEWRIFTVYSMSKGSSWVKHCTGQITVVYERGQSEVEDGHADISWQKQVICRTALLESDSISVEVDAFYSGLDAIGMQYGPSFANVASLTAVPSQNASYGTVAVPDTKSTMPSHHESPHIIHPATLDSIFHLVIASLDGGHPKQSAVPYAIEELYIARDQPKAGTLYSGYGRLLSQSGHEMSTELFVSDETWNTPKLTIKNFALRQVTSGDESDIAGNNISFSMGKKCCRVSWIPHPSFVSRDESSTAPLPASVILLLPASPSPSIEALAKNVENNLTVASIDVIRTNLIVDGDVAFDRVSVISLLEIDSPLTCTWNESEFNAFKRLVSSVRHLFWITRGSLLESWSNGVEFATTQGLFRVMRNEYPAAILPSLDLSATADICSDQLADLITEVWKDSLAEDAEREYAERNQLIHVARATEDTGFDNELQLASNNAKPVFKPLGISNQPLKAVKYGDEYIWVSDEVAELDLKEGEVEVKVAYVGLGKSHDLASAQHCVGRVVRLSRSVKSLELGQLVVVFSHSVAQTHVRQIEALVAPLPEGVEPQEAIALIEPLLAAAYALLDRVHLNSGQIVLIDDAATAVGQAMILVAKQIGAEVFSLVHSRAEKNILTEKYGLPSDHIFDSAWDNFIPLVQEITSNRCVDVVVNQQNGSHVVGAISLLGDFGQFVNLSKESSGADLCKSNASFHRIDMSALIQSQPNLVARLFKTAFKEYALQGPAPFTVLPITDLSSAKSEPWIGEAVVSLGDTMLVPMPAPQPKDLRLDGEATYVLAGGLGALGLDVANWMVECGAKNLVFLSRSGGSKHADTLQSLVNRGIQAQPFACNVNDHVSVATIFDSLKSSGRRIAGVVQLAMVLEDGIFDNMSFEQWSRAIEPKTRGSKNLLANLWPGDDPFYILLSSITGIIGNTAQANYASGNTFEDALAHHARNHLGINATSIDVGLVSDSSHFTSAGEFGDLNGYLSRYQHGWRGLQTNLHELGVVMRAIMRGSTTDREPLPAQVVLGLGDRIEYDKSVDGFAKDKKFELRVVEVGGQDGNGETKESVGTRMENAQALAEAAAAVEENIKELVAAAMGVSLEDVDAQRPLYDYGVDSLQAVEIRNRALKYMQSEISVFDILSAMPLADVAMKIASKSQLVRITGGDDN